MPAHGYRTSSGRLFPVESVPLLNMHKIFLRIERTSPDKERIRRMRNGHRRMRNGQETHADGDERIENFVLHRTSVNAIR